MNAQPRLRALDVCLHDGGRRLDAALASLRAILVETLATNLAALPAASRARPRRRR